MWNYTEMHLLIIILIFSFYYLFMHSNMCRVPNILRWSCAGVSEDSDEHADHKVKHVKASNQMIYQINALIIRQLRAPTPKPALNNLPESHTPYHGGATYKSTWKNERYATECIVEMLRFRWPSKVQGWYFFFFFCLNIIFFCCMLKVLIACAKSPFIVLKKTVEVFEAVCQPERE